MVTIITLSADANTSDEQQALPVGKDLAVIVDLDLQNLIFVQPAGYRPPKHLQLKQTECVIT